MKENNQKIWVAANYCFPGLYSCKTLMSSPHSAQCLPAPGPSTVRGSLVRKGIEHYGVIQTRDILFPIIREIDVAIQPPKQVGITPQSLLTYKVIKDRFSEAIGFREFAHTDDTLTIFLKIPKKTKDIFIELLSAIGYWGQASSLTYCQQISEATPHPKEIIQPLSTLSDIKFGNNFTAFMGEWEKEKATWNGISFGTSNFLKIDLYVYPLEICEVNSEGQKLVFRPLE